MPETKSGLFYRVYGSGPAIVLIHGFPADGNLWRNIWEPLSVCYTILVPDLPGTGASPLTGHTGLSEMADAVNEILEQENQPAAVIAGHSMGGYIALAFARKYPGKTKGISLVHSTPLADDDEKKATRGKAIELIAKGGLKPFIAQMVPNLFSVTTKLHKQLIVNVQTEESQKIPAASLVNFYRAMMERPDNTPVLENALFPLQWICGQDDNIIPIKKTMQLCFISGINFVSLYKDCGHMSMLENPQQLTDDLNAFGRYCYSRQE